MSIKTYLFLLIGALIALLTASQLFLVDYLQKQFAQQVDSKARVISERVIKLAAEQVADEAFVFNTESAGTATSKAGTDNAQAYKYVIRHEKSASAVDPELTDENIDFIVVKPDLEELDGETIIELDVDTLREKAGANGQDKTIQIVSNQEVKTLLLDELKTITDRLHEQPNQQVKEFHTIDHNTSGVTHIATNTQSFSFSSDKNSSLIRQIIYVLILSSLAALLFAYWLSHKFSKPLKALSEGFTHIATGDYKHQVEEQGVSEIRQTIQHFNDTQGKLEQLSITEQQYQQTKQLAELGEVSKGLAHALRNPIHTIGLALENLKALPQSEQQSVIETIEQKIQHIDSTIKAMLQLTTQQLQEPTSVPIAAVVQDIILEYKATDTRALKINLDDKDSVNLLANESELRAILHTVIINACEASDMEQGIDVRISRGDNSKVVIEVEDQGSGIAADIEQHLFKPHTSNKPEGAGMGLYIAQRLISSYYHGDITLANSQSGCLVTITLFPRG